MPFVIRTDDEELPLEFPDETGDGQPSIVWYGRLGANKKRELVAKYGRGKGAARFFEWKSEDQQAFSDAVIKTCFRRAEGFVDANRNPVEVTIDDILAQNEDFKTKIYEVCHAAGSKRKEEEQGN